MSRWRSLSPRRMVHQQRDIEPSINQPINSNGYKEYAVLAKIVELSDRYASPMSISGLSDRKGIKDCVLWSAWWGRSDMWGLDRVCVATDNRHDILGARLGFVDENSVENSRYMCKSDVEWVYWFTVVHLGDTLRLLLGAARSERTNLSLQGQIKVVVTFSTWKSITVGSANSQRGWDKYQVFCT